MKLTNNDAPANAGHAMVRRNCWEVKQCGQGPEQRKNDGKPICPAARSGPYDGINRGKFAGRFCWAVTGTFCGGRMQGMFTRKFIDCLNCAFFQEVDRQEGRFLVLTPYDAELLLQGQRSANAGDSGNVDPENPSR